MAQPQTFLFGVDLDVAKNQLKQARFENLGIFPTAPAGGQFFFNTADSKFYGWNNTAWIDLSQVVLSPVTLKGEITNAASNPGYPASPTVGDSYFVTGQAGTVGGVAVEVGDELVYSNSGWMVVQRNLVAATQAAAGFMRLATQAEVNTATDASTAISPLTLATFLAGFLYSRKVRVPVTSLVANTPQTITHGLNVANPEDIHVAFSQGGNPIQFGWQATSTNAISIVSNQTYGNVTVVIIG
jgi:hypothetical protein